MTSTLSRIFLYGPPGSGKSSLGRTLAESLDLPFYDLDTEIEANAGRTIPDLVKEQGEPGLRARERACLAALLDRPAGVISLGGGSLLDPESRARVEACGRVLCLGASAEVLSGRLRGNTGLRPLIGNPQDAESFNEGLASLLERRAGHYASFAAALETTGLTIQAAALEAQIRLGAFRVRGMGGGYAVRVQPGSLDGLGDALRETDLAGPAALVSDENVASLYADRAAASLEAAGYTLRRVVLPPGETHKTYTAVARLWEAFLDAGLERGSTVVALGGGVVSDLAGFAAAVFLRGVRWVVVPTSLLAMADASLGGKTGADLPQGKNLIGAFHPPSLVLADPDLLASLPEAELRSGLAEVVKHGVLGDPALYAACAQGWEPLHAGGFRSATWDEIVRRAMAVKIRVIEADPYERGVRAALNLGHTVGHALEQVTGFQLRHGEAVAIGMAAEARLAVHLGLAEDGLAGEIAGTLQALGLPVEIPAGISRESLLQAMQVDKKRAAGQVRFALPVRIGEVRWGIAVDPDQILR